MATELSFDEILRVLVRHDVKFIVVGGVAAILQGAPLVTEDLDVVYLCSAGNNTRLADALAELGACYFDPAGRGIEPDVSKLAALKMHLLQTRHGRVDVLRTVGKDLAFEDLAEKSRVFEIAELQVRVLDLETVIETKEHANRPKDRYQLLYLRQLLAETRRPEAERSEVERP